MACAGAFAQYPYRLTEPGAQENFRLGVQAYHKGRMAESVLLFERVLSQTPRDPLTLFWLGRVYYKNGLESTALERWEAAVRDGGALLLTESHREYVASRRAIEPEIGRGGYIPTGEFVGRRGKETQFLRPSWLHPQPDGSLLVVSHGSNDILRMDINGVTRARYRGGLGGFDYPFALAPDLEGGFWVSEFQGNRITLCGRDGEPVLRIAGGKGRERLSGPQYIATDSSGFLFVVDYGNGRVVKYSPKGEYLLEFGKSSTSSFPGFRSPSGIAVREGRVYVADTVLRAVYVFDDSGNYTDTLAEGYLIAPEGLSFFAGELLIADKRRVAALDIGTRELREIYRSSRADARIVSAVRDVNGNIVASDFDASVVEILSDPAVVYGGYFVEIERIRPDAFPVVEADVYVRDRFGNPIVGLDQGNFYASERIVTTKNVKEGETEARVRSESMVPVTELTLLGRGSDSSDLAAAVLVERSPQMDSYRTEVRQAVENTVASLGAGAETILVTAGRVPAMIAGSTGTSGGPSLARQALSAATDPSWRFDTSLRLAVSHLAANPKRTAVVYITTGGVREEGFESASLAELGAYLRNNGIRFYTVLIGDAPASAAVRYLVQTAGGAILGGWDAAGLRTIGTDLKTSPSGRYRIRFMSAADPGFGRSYLSAVIEAYLFKKSGRDEMGYFTPLR